MNIADSDKDVPAAFANLEAITYDGYAFRVLSGDRVIHNPKFEHLWAGTGAGRCNPEGVARVYLSLERETADAEFRHYQKIGGLDPDLVNFYSFSTKVNLARVLDLRDAGTRRKLRISLNYILAEWEPDPLIDPPPPITRLQVIGYWISKGHGDFSGIVCPSARRKNGHNLVIYKDRVIGGDSVIPVSSVATKGWS